MHLSVFSCVARRLSTWLLSAFLVLVALPSYAQIDVPSNWPLKPADLNVGDEFRLLLMARNGMKATSTDIADYDAFVQEIIGRIGHADIREYSANFKVLASTATVDAREHTGTTGVEGVPIYWLNSSIVATSYSDLYDGSWPNKGAATLQDGVPISDGRSHQAICTGTGTHGSATALPLGAQRCTSTTIATTTSALGGRTHPNSARARYLALSDVFRVGDSTIVTTPTIAGVEITSDPGSDGDYVAGDVIEATVTFSEPVAVTGTPRLKFSLNSILLDPMAKLALYSATESTATELVFQYSVTAADYAYEGISFPRNALELNGGTIQNQAGTADADLAYQAINVQRDHLVYIPPTVSIVTLASTPAANGIYVTGETIKLDLTWDRKIAVFGSPLLHFFVAAPEDVILAGDTRTAAYTTTIGEYVTRFEYEVQTEDSDPDGISLLPNGNIQWNGGHIIRQGHGDHADKDSVNAKNSGGHFGLPAQPGHRVNVSPPADATLSALTLADGDGNAISLNPAFDTETTLYAASVNNAVSPITVTPTTTDDGATVEYLDGSDIAIADADSNEEEQQVSLAVGANIVKVKVTAEDGVTTRTYAVTVTRAAANAAATGKPAISGTAQVGQTLTAGLGTIADANGVPGTVTYQWVRVDADGSSNPTDIGTNSSTYAPVAADVGKKIRVEISFTDDGGSAEGPLASDAVPKTGTVVTANSIACPADSDWCTEVTLSYASNSITDSILSERWGFGSDATPGAIDDATFSHGETAYTINGLELYRFTVTGTGASDLVTLKVKSGELPDGTVLTLDGTEFTIDEQSDTPDTGKEQWSFGPPGLSFDWGQGRKVTVSLKLPPAGAATGKPAVAGAPQVGETLTAGLGTIADVDGVPGTLTYQWVRVDADGSSNPTNIGTNSSTYAPVAADVGKKIRVEISFTDSGGNAEGPLASNAVPEAGTVVPAKAACPADADWCTEMTLYYTAAHQPHFYERWGYSSISTPSGAIGDNTFSHGGREYTVERLGLNRDHLSSGPNDLLTFEPVSGELPDGTVLTLDGTEFTVGIVSDTLETKKEQWSPKTMGIMLNWVKGQKVTVSLTFPSVDAMLGALALSDGDGNAIVLDPTFESGKTSYTVSVGNAVAKITVTPELSDDGATVAYLDGSNSAIADADTIAAGQQVALAVGPNTIKVKIMAGDGVTTRTYAVTVTRAAANAAATGKPAISGTAQVGHTLIAAKGQIDDAEGTTKADNGDAGYAYTYQWVRVDADGTSNPHDIGSATSNTYTLVAADEGKKVKVKLSFKDDAGNVEERTSDAYPASETVAAGGGGLIATLFEQESVEGTGGRFHYVFDLHLSTGVSKSYRDVRDHVFTVAGGSTVGARRIHRDNLPRPGTNQLALVSNHWRVEVRPSTDHGEVTVAMTANRACDQDGALCSLDGNTLSNAPSLILAPSYPTLSIADTSADEDDGELRFTITLSRALQRYDVLYDVETVEGGSATEGVDYTAQARVTNRIQKGAVTQEFVVPLIDDAVDDDGETVKVRIGNAKLEDDNGGQRTITIARAEATGTIGSADTTTQPVPDTLTASFEDVPSEHNGYTPFTLRLAFSAPIVTSPAVLRNQALTVTGGTVTAVRQVNGRSDLWEITVDQSGTPPVTVRLASSSACDQPGAVCTSDGRALSNAPSATVRGKPALSVADAEVEEAPGAMLVFVVTLDRPPTDPVTANWKTLDRTATAGQDYTEASGSIAFDVGETEKTISVAVLDDAIDEGDETLFLLLPSAQGARSVDPLAVGTIKNSDPMPQAWLARFGRTVAEQVIEAVGTRLAGARTPGTRLQVAGLTLDTDTLQATDEQFAVAEEAEAAKQEEMTHAQLQTIGQWVQHSGLGRPGGFEEPQATLDTGRLLTSRALLRGTSFSLADESFTGSLVSLWGRGAVTRFDGQEDAIRLDGEVETLMLGADWSKAAWTTGVLFSHSRGDGDWSGEDAGRVESTLTGIWPYGRYQYSERLSLWGIAGYGEGDLDLKPEGMTAMEADIDLVMGALGVRGVALQAPQAGGFELAIISDVMAIRTSADRTVGLASAEADVTRLRLGLEGTWQGLEVGSGTWVPHIEGAIRHDGGDAETGFGAEIGTGLTFHHEHGISGEIRARGLLTHEESGFENYGISGSLAWDPKPASHLGPSLTISQTLGAPDSGGMDALLERTTMAGLHTEDHDNNTADNHQLELKAGYGLGIYRGQLILSPELGLVRSPQLREYQLGTRIDLAGHNPGSVQLECHIRRREPVEGQTNPEHAISLQFNGRF